MLIFINLKQYLASGSPEVRRYLRFYVKYCFQYLDSSFINRSEILF